jgi:L-asparaginase
MVFTGGTISMRPDPDAGGNTPVLGGAEILAMAPDLARIADIEPVDWGLVPASHLRFSQILEIARLLESQLARPEIDGAVVVQGTDSIEETAFAFDLLLPDDKPVVVTGAMRDASAADYDGPRNLADAVRCAVESRLAGRGVQVVLGGLIVPAAEVVKTHSTALDTFQPRDGPPTGRVAGEDVILEGGRATARRGLPRIPADPVENVPLVTVVTGMDGTLVRALAPLEPSGLVVAATGSGNTHPDLLAACVDLMAIGTVVCLTTRCPRGVVAPIYAFPGGGAAWRRAGALLSTLDGPKTRVALALGLACGLSRAELSSLVGGELASA